MKTLQSHELSSIICKILALGGSKMAFKQKTMLNIDEGFQLIVMEIAANYLLFLFSDK
jgi:hypothetical protein